MGTAARPENAGWPGSHPRRAAPGTAGRRRARRRCEATSPNAARSPRRGFRTPASRTRGVGCRSATRSPRAPRRRDWAAPGARAHNPPMLRADRSRRRAARTPCPRRTPRPLVAPRRWTGRGGFRPATDRSSLARSSLLASVQARHYGRAPPGQSARGLGVDSQTHPGRFHPDTVCVLACGRHTPGSG